MRRKSFLLIAAAALAAMMAFGCARADDDPEDAPEDSTAPIAGSQIAFSAAAPTGLIVSWGAGSDDATAASDLRYKLVKALSGDSIDTVSEADAVSAADLVMDWTTNALSTLVAESPGGDSCYFAVIMRDEADNMAMYSPQALPISSSYELIIRAGFPITAPGGAAEIYIYDNATKKRLYYALEYLDSLGSHEFIFSDISDTYFKEQLIGVSLYKAPRVNIGNYNYVLNGLVSGEILCTVRDGGVFTVIALP